jgi:hypothetical protein
MPVANRRATVLVEPLLQWDDELVARDSNLALFDAFASREKTLHANPGRHAGVPAFELESSDRLFIRHLVEGGASVAATWPIPQGLYLVPSHGVLETCCARARQQPLIDLRDGESAWVCLGGSAPGRYTVS